MAACTPPWRARWPPGRHQALVLSGGTHDPGLSAIGEAHLENLPPALPQGGCLDRGHHLDARRQVSRHPVGGTDVEVSLPAAARACAVPSGRLARSVSESGLI
jgi:hypothetical protein